MECSILPGGDVPPGATVILTNTMKTSIAYSVFLGPISMLYEPKQSVRVDLPPGESRRLSQPLAFWMLGSQVIATSGQTAANCSMLWASWRWLVVVGALLALAGLLCLGAGAYRNRRSSDSLHQG